MSEAAAKPDGDGEKRQRGKNRRSITFQEMLERRNFSVPDEAFRLYKALANPFAVFIQQYRAAGMPEMTIERLAALVDANAAYYKRKLDLLKIIATFSHAKPKEEGPLKGKRPPEQEPPAGETKPPPTKNPYEDMSAEELIAGLPKTDEHFDSGPTSPGS